MTEALVAHDPTLAVPMKPEQLQARLKLIQDVMRTVMRVDEDYGTIPGTDKPTLFKPGAEKILVTLRLTAAEPIVEDLGSDDVIRYRVKVPIETTAGVCLGMGIGECSSNEEKYKWRRPVWDSKEFDDTPADRRRKVWKKIKGRAQTIDQVRTEPADVANTILKMAHKRALVHGTLLATAAGSVFGQDLEDIPDEVRENLVGDERESAPSEPRRKSAGPAGAAASSTPQPPTTAAPAPPATEFTRGVTIDKTEYIEKPQPDGTVDKFYQVWAKKNRALVCFETREQTLFAEAATCEGSGETFTIEFRRDKRDNKPVFIMVGLKRDDAMEGQAHG